LVVRLTSVALVLIYVFVSEAAYLIVGRRAILTDYVFKNKIIEFIDF
jgi:hypothetical protein